MLHRVEIARKHGKEMSARAKRAQAFLQSVGHATNVFEHVEGEDRIKRAIGPWMLSPKPTRKSADVLRDRANL
jgi:hypothetical protein